MQRGLSMRKIVELLRLKYELKLSHRAIAASLKISSSTVSEYLQRAEVAKISWPLPVELTEEALHQKLFSSVSPFESKEAPDWSAIHIELRKKGVTLQLLWHEYLSVHPQGLSYSQFCRRYREQQKLVEPVMRFVHRAGENCFVDYAGVTVPWVELATGEVCEAQIFVGCLGASNYTYVEARASQGLQDWLSCHAHMFSFFGGVPQNCVPDNLLSGVTKAHRYDPDINVTYQHFAQYYGIAILPARAYKPRDKAKVENAVQQVERHLLAPLRHRTFTSIAKINQALWELLSCFNAKPFQKLEGSRWSVFESVDKPALKALPAQPYEWSDWRCAKVHVDYHIVYEKHCYSVPYRFISQTLKVRATATTIECYCHLQRVALHARHTRPGYTTLAEHMPPAHQHQTQGSIDYFRQKAALIGPQTEHYIQQLMNHRAFPQQGFRACQGILRLGQRYGHPRLELACQRGLLLGMYRYRDIESMLKNNLETASITEPTTRPLPLHDNVRGSSYYQFNELSLGENDEPNHLN